MPPPVQDIPLPTDRGSSATRYLENFSIIPNQNPPLRSSMVGSALSDPFQFYLTSRLDLKPALQYSEALSRGTWFHTCMEAFYQDPATASLFFDRKLQERQAELTRIMAEVGIPPTGHQDILNRERHDALTSRSWFFASAALPIIPVTGGGETESVIQYFRRPYWRVPTLNGRASTELLLGWWDGTNLSVIKPDLLVYHQDQNKLWLVDLKTTSLTPRDRAKSCPFDFQTIHYQYVMDQLLRERVIQEPLGLPTDVQLGGMIHWIVQKPPLKFGQGDRDFTMTRRTLSRGPRAGQTIEEKVFAEDGEPRTENYVRRIYEWYSGTGEYTHERQDRLQNPPINLSFTNWRGELDRDSLSEYDWVKSRIKALCTCEPHPINFPRTGQSLVPTWGSENPYAELHHASPTAWPNIIRQNHLIVQRRDPQLHGVRQSLITSS